MQVSKGWDVPVSLVTAVAEDPTMKGQKAVQVISSFISTAMGMLSVKASRNSPPPSIVPDPKLFNSHPRCPDQILDAVRASYKKGGAGKDGAGGDNATLSPISCASLAALVLIAGRQISLRYTTDAKGLQDKSQRIMPWTLNAGF